MPMIYQGHCSACGAVTPKTTGSYIAMFVDEPTASAQTHPDDPHLVVLTSPTEQYGSDETIAAEASAERQGRLVWCEQVYCGSCGRMFEIRSLTASITMLGWAGGVGLVAVAAAAAFGVGFLVGGEWQGFVAGACLFVLLLGGTESGMGWFIRWRHPERAARVATPRMCPACGSFWRLSVTSRVGGITCTTCGERAMAFRVVRT